jgi:hypothetical protein
VRRGSEGSEVVERVVLYQPGDGQRQPQVVRGAKLGAVAASYDSGGPSGISMLRIWALNRICPAAAAASTAVLTISLSVA